MQNTSPITVFVKDHVYTQRARESFNLYLLIFLLFNVIAFVGGVGCKFATVTHALQACSILGDNKKVFFRKC